MKYPAGIKKEVTHTINYANRGMTLENDLNLTNEFYRLQEIAFIYKKPTPIKITKVEYPSKNKAIIKEAFFEAPSTTDYNGIYRGKYIDFEAKETKNSTSFPINNIHPHQLKHIKNIYKQGGIVFLIVRFTSLDETYLLLGKDLLIYLESTSKSSIPLVYFQKKAHLIKSNYEPRIDYLKIVDNIMEE